MGALISRIADAPVTDAPLTVNGPHFQARPVHISSRLRLGFITKAARW